MVDFNMWSPSPRERLEYAKIRNENLENRMRDIMDMLTQNKRILDSIRESGLVSTPDQEHPHNLSDADVDIASLYPPLLRRPLVDREREVTPGYHTCSYGRGGIHGQRLRINPYRHVGVHGKEPSTEQSVNINDYDMI